MGGGGGGCTVNEQGGRSGKKITAPKVTEEAARHIYSSFLERPRALEGHHGRSLHHHDVVGAASPPNAQVAAGRADHHSGAGRHALGGDGNDSNSAGASATGERDSRACSGGRGRQKK